MLLSHPVPLLYAHSTLLPFPITLSPSPAHVQTKYAVHKPYLPVPALPASSAAQLPVPTRPLSLQLLPSPPQAHGWMSNINQTHQTHAFPVALEMTDQTLIKRKKTLEVSAMIDSSITLQMSHGQNEESPAFRFFVRRLSAPRTLIFMLCYLFT